MTSFRTAARRYPRLLTPLLAVSLSLTGCVNVPPGSGLKAGTPSGAPVQREAWVATVNISDITVKDAPILATSLRSNLTAYIRQRGLFLKTDTLPGQVKGTDVVLDFTFDRYQQNRNPHPAYFPAAILTLTGYIWAGGPIFVDTTDLSGKLVVKDATGNVLVTTTAVSRDAHNVSLWSPDYALPSGIEGRTALASDLLDKAVTELKTRTP